MPNRASRQPVERATFLEEVKPLFIHVPSWPSELLMHLSKPQLNSSQQPIRTGPSFQFFPVAKLSSPDKHIPVCLLLAAGPQTWLVLGPHAGPVF